MNAIHIPNGAWMRLRQHGSYKYSQKRAPIIWQGTPPPTGADVYCVGWRDGQQNLQATEIIKQP